MWARPGPGAAQSNPPVFVPNATITVMPVTRPVVANANNVGELLNAKLIAGTGISKSYNASTGEITLTVP